MPEPPNTPSTARILLSFSPEKPFLHHSPNCAGVENPVSAIAGLDLPLRRKRSHRVSSFSIVLDYPWWIAAGFFGAAAAIIVYLPPKILASRVRQAAAVLFFAAMLWSGAHYFTWSVRIDERGASVQDAAALFQPTGSIPWGDRARIAIGKGFR